MVQAQGVLLQGQAELAKAQNQTLSLQIDAAKVELKTNNAAKIAKYSTIWISINSPSLEFLKTVLHSSGTAAKTLAQMLSYSLKAMNRRTSSEWTLPISYNRETKSTFRQCSRDTSIRELIMEPTTEIQAAEDLTLSGDYAAASADSLVVDNANDNAGQEEGFEIVLKDDETAPKQDPAKNAEFARRRIERKRQRELEQQMEAVKRGELPESLGKPDLPPQPDINAYLSEGWPNMTMTTAVRLPLSMLLIPNG